jgi:hypothetical protein
MDLKALDKALQELIKSRAELADLDYNNPKYDDLEEKLHDSEDAFQDKYGEFLENALQDIHDEHCPDSDVLMPIAYLAKKYHVSDKGEYSVDSNEGVFVETEKYAGKDTKLVILPNPIRIALNIGKDKQIIVWQAK